MKWFIKHDCNESSPADCSVTLENSSDSVEIGCSGKLLLVVFLTWLQMYNLFSNDKRSKDHTVVPYRHVPKSLHRV